MENLILEGSTVVDVGSVFYNPKMKLNRDICVAISRSLRIGDYLDALAASGVRGLRVAKEARVERVTLNDVSRLACELIRKNVDLNQLTSCEVCCKNSNVLMHERHFDAVDLDPFGSPSPFIAAAARSATSHLFITATDTAPLCGAHKKSGVRKYMAEPVKTEYHREMGARILLGAAARELARLDKGMVPLLTHATDHYLRTYLSIQKGAKFADKSILELGYLEHCHRCGWRKTHKGIFSRGATICLRCGEATDLAGPLWLGPIHDSGLVESAIEKLVKMVDEDDRALKVLQMCRDEIVTPMYYDHHRICKRLRITPGRIEEVIEALRNAGFQASRTHFSGVGIKTDASIEALEGVLHSNV